MAKITLKFKREELLYDIKSIAYKAARVASSDEVKVLLTDIGEEGSIDRVTRILDLKVSLCVEELYAFTKESVEKEEQYDDTLKETALYVINMNVPDTFSKTTADYLEKLIHEYLVYRVLAEWMIDINNDNSDDRGNKWLLKADNIKGEIESSLYRNIVPVRRKQHPFP